MTESFKEFIAEAKNKAFAPDDIILVGGFGRVKVSQLDNLFKTRFKDVEKFAKKKDWKNVLFLIESTNLIPIIKALKEVQEANQ